MIYHLLPEQEVFSAYRSGAIAKNIANIMRFDVSGVVVCQAADETLGCAKERIIVIPQLHEYAKVRGRGRLPVWVSRGFLRHAFKPFLAMLRDGDIIWCHNQPCFAAAIERSVHLKGAKLIYHSHDGCANYGRRTAIRSFKADAYIFVSNALRQKWLKLFPGLERTYAVPNGADERLFYPAVKTPGVERSVPIILYVGRLHPEKGVHVLIDAMRILQERNINALCRVVGSSFTGGSRATSYVRSLQEGCPSNVKLAGYLIRREIAEEYRAADILCCPSIWQEPFGNINIEAMACGLPVVATSVGGIPEIAAEGGVLLVKPNSAIEIADTLKTLLESRQLRVDIAAEGLKSFSRNFTWGKIVKRYEEIVDSL